MNQIVIITGANGGIGRKIVKSFDHPSNRLILLDYEKESLEVLAKSCEARVETVACDLCNEQDYVEKLKPIIENGVDVLINNAAFGGTTVLKGWAEDFEGQTLEAWRLALEVNLLAPFRLTQLCAQKLRESEDGNIINVASIYGIGGQIPKLYEGTQMKNPAAYGSSKAGLIQLTKWLATTLAPDIRVNSISPGGIERGQPQEFIERYEELTPMGRMGTEEDMLGAISFLSGRSASYITGQNLIIDGGWSSW